MIKLSRVIWIFLIPASLPARAVWFVKNSSRNAALPPFPNPPVANPPHENLGSTPPADPLTGCSWVGIDTSGNPVDLCEELLVKQRCELFGGILNVLDDFLVDLLWCHTVFSQIIKKDIDFDGVSLKTFIDVGGLD